MARKKNQRSTSRDSHRAEVFKMIRAQPIISRSKLSQKVSPSRATVSSIVAEFIDTGLLEEIGEGESTGGRRPIRLRYCPESRWALGVVLFDDGIHGALTDMEGNLIKYERFPMQGSSAEAMLSQMKKILQHILETSQSERILGIGVGTPGIVDSKTGTIQISVSKGWINKGIEVKEFLQRELDLPVYVTNRSRVAALGELKIGIGKGVSNLIYLFLGQGIAAGIILDGQLYLGSDFAAGEIGHVTVDPNGPLCACGNRGCLECYAAEAAILASARAKARSEPKSLLSRIVQGDLERINFHQIISCAQDGDPIALELFRDVGYKVGLAISTLVDILNPEMVILGGPIGCEAGDLLLKPAIEESSRRGLPWSINRTRIVSGELGTEAVAIGAAVFAISQTPLANILRI